MAYLTDNQIKAMAQEVLNNTEVSYLSHSRKMEIAVEYAIEEFGVKPKKSAVLLAVKLANVGWEACKYNSAAAVESADTGVKYSTLAAFI